MKIAMGVSTHATGMVSGSTATTTDTETMTAIAAGDSKNAGESNSAGDWRSGDVSKRVGEPKSGGDSKNAGEPRSGGESNSAGEMKSGAATMIAVSVGAMTTGTMIAPATDAAVHVTWCTREWKIKHRGATQAVRRARGA